MKPWVTLVAHLITATSVSYTNPANKTDFEIYKLNETTKSTQKSNHRNELEKTKHRQYDVSLSLDIIFSTNLKIQKTHNVSIFYRTYLEVVANHATFCTCNIPDMFSIGTSSLANGYDLPLLFMTLGRVSCHFVISIHCYMLCIIILMSLIMILFSANQHNA